MRALVRMKVADDMDIVAAKQAVNTAAAFFKALQARAAANSTTPFDCIQTLQMQ